MSDNSPASLIKPNEATKRKRGRPPKTHSYDNTDIDFPTSHLTDSEAKELLLGYRLLKEIMAIPKIKPLLDEPDENFFGLHDYYSVIEKPMWFNEICRKYASMDYKEVKQVVDDIRQVLENSYVFWGIKNKVGKLAYRIEKIVDKHISEFPEHLKKLCSLGKPEKPTVINKLDYERDAFVTEEFNSKMLEILAKKEKSESEKEMIIDPALQKWEQEVLTTKQKAKEIRIMAELPEIGHFIKLSSEILGLKDVTQYEVERMLLMPKESTTLATIMTCLLCPTSMRGNLYFKPIMIYDVWASLLKKKLEGWYNLYFKTNNKLQVFIKYGIEPYFWETLGEQNPLSDCDFHSLNFSQKACILKALCTTMFQSNKKIEELFNCVSGGSLRGETIFRDSKFTYISLFGSETRVYRLSKTHTGLKHMIETIVPDCEDTSFVEDQVDIPNQPDNPKSSCTKKQQFYMIASNKESLKLLCKTLTKKKKSLCGVHNLLERDESDKYYLKGLKAMFTQWQKSLNRSTSVIENSINYWMNKETENTSIKSDFFPDIENQKEVLGKRVPKKKFTLEDVESSSNDEKLSEDNVSDWEDDNIRQGNRIKPVKAVPRFFDKRFMTFKRSSDDSIQEIRTPVTPSVAHPEPPKVDRRINNYVSRSGVRITRIPNYVPRRSVVDAAIENARNMPAIPDNSTKFLTIDMKTGTVTSQNLQFQEQNFQDPNINFNQMPVLITNGMTNFEDTNNFQHISVYNVNNDMTETGNNQIIPNMMGDHMDYNLSGQNQVLQNFQTGDYQSQYDPVLFISDSSNLNEIMGMPFMDTSAQSGLNFNLNDVSQESPSTLNEDQTL